VNPFLTGFVDELVKVAGAKKSVGKGLWWAIRKHPLATLGVGATAAATGLAARQGYRGGKAMGGKTPGYLAVTRQMRETGRIAPTAASRTNWHRLFPDHPMSKNKNRAAFKRRNINYRESAFR
jgi:hypothetical protein